MALKQRTLIRKHFSNYMVCAMVFSNSFVVKSVILISAKKNDTYMYKKMQFFKVLSF